MREFRSIQKTQMKIKWGSGRHTELYAHIVAFTGLHIGPFCNWWHFIGETNLTVSTVTGKRSLASGRDSWHSRCFVRILAHRSTNHRKFYCCDRYVSVNRVRTRWILRNSMNSIICGENGICRTHRVTYLKHTSHTLRAMEANKGITSSLAA